MGGRVVETGKLVRRLCPGDRVTVQPNLGCGECYHCRRGRPNLCPDRRSLGVNAPGCFAEYVVVPEEYVWVIPDALSWEDAAVVEPLAVAVRAVRRGAPPIGGCVLIIGLGTIGLFILQVLRGTGAAVYCADTVESKLRTAWEMGASRAANSREISPGDLAASVGGFDLVFDAAGLPATFEGAVEAIRPGGRLVAVGLSERPPQLNALKTVRGELELLGSYIYRDEFRTAIDLVADRRVDIPGMITHRLPFAEVSRAFEVYPKEGTRKVILFPPW